MLVPLECLKYSGGTLRVVSTTNVDGDSLVSCPVESGRGGL